MHTTVPAVSAAVAGVAPAANLEQALLFAQLQTLRRLEAQRSQR